MLLCLQDSIINMETSEDEDRNPVVTVNHAGWIPPDVAGVFHVLMDLDVFLQGQGDDVPDESGTSRASAEYCLTMEDQTSTEAGRSASPQLADFTSYVTGACIECVSVDVGSAIMNTVRNSHAPCLQCIVNNFTTSNGCELERLNLYHEVTSNLTNVFPLLEAVERGNDGVVHLFLRFLKDCGCLLEALSSTDARGRMPVHLAAYHDHLASLDLLLDCTPMETAYWKDKQPQQMTPLHHAAAGGAVRCLRRLLKIEDCMVTTKTGRTAVSLSAQAGSVSCLEELIDQANADPKKPDQDGMTPVHFAAQAGHLNCTHWLIRRARCSLSDSRKKDGATAMHLAAGRGRCPILQWALNRELSLAQEMDVFGRTPVHYAAEEGHITALRTFAKFPRAQLDAKDFLGRTPSNLAERRGHSACVRFLDSCLQQRHPDGEGALLAKLTRSISSPGGLNNKLNRRNSNRRSSRRKHISSVYLEEKTHASSDAESEPTDIKTAASSGEGTGHIARSLICQIGGMTITPAVPDILLHRRIINNLFRRLRSEAHSNIEEEFTATM